MNEIVLIDDNTSNIDFFCEIFSLLMSEYHLHAATRGEEALEILAKIAPSLILLDIQMPGMTGYDVLKKIREEKHLSEVPVVALSAFAMPGEIDRAIKSGFTGYITKPIRIKEFVDQVHSYMKQ